MLALIRQELYKQLHGKFYIGWGIVTLAMALFAGFVYHSSKELSQINANGPIFSSAIIVVLVAMIVFASSILTTDFSNNTVKYLFARQFSRGKIFLSKLVTIVVMYVYLLVVSFVSTLIANALFNKMRSIPFDVFGNRISGMSFYLFLMLSLVLLISCLFKSNAVAIAIGIVFYFVVSIINPFLSIFIYYHSWVKYIPLTFLNVYSQTISPMMSEMTKLSLNEMRVGSIIWGIVFLLITYVVYNRRNV